MSNYAINLAFLETYARENGYALSPRQLASMARRFTRWEVRNVFCHKNGYEDFRDQVICLDYDELLEMYVEETVHPAVRPPMAKPWQLRLLPKRGDGADRPCLTRDATMPATICLIAPPSYRAKLLRPTTK